MRGTEHPAASGKLKGCLHIVRRLDGQPDVGNRIGVLVGLVVTPGPAFRGPEPVVVQGVAGHDPAKRALVDLAHDRRAGGILASRAQALLHHLGNSQRGFGAEAGLHPQLLRKLEGVAKLRPHAVEYLIAVRGADRQRTVAGQHWRRPVVPFEQQGRAETVTAGLLRKKVPPARLQQGVVVARHVAELNAPVRVKVVRHAVPDGRFRVGQPLRIAMHAQEVHPHLGELGEDRFVIVRAPGVEPKRMRSPGIDPAQGEQRPAHFIHLRQHRRYPRVRNCVAMQIEPHAELLRKTIRAVQRAKVVAADDQHQSAAAV